MCIVNMQIDSISLAFLHNHNIINHMVIVVALFRNSLFHAALAVGIICSGDDKIIKMLPHQIELPIEYGIYSLKVNRTHTIGV